MHRAAKYLAALGIVAVALALKAPFASLGADHPFLLLPGAVIIATWYGGRGPGIVATVAAALGADILYLPPLGIGTSLGEVFALAVLAGEGALIVAVTDGLRAAQLRAAREAAAADQASREVTLALRMREELIDTWTRKALAPVNELAESLRQARAALRDRDASRATAALDQIETDLGLLQRTTEHWQERGTDARLS